MARHISDNSRKYSLLALGELSEIKKEYSSAPKIASLDKYKTSYLNDKMRNFLDCIKKTRYKGFSFLKKADKVRDILERNATGANPQEIEEGWREFFAFMDDAELELKRSVSLSYSQNTNIRQFEKFGSKMFGDETARKKITQALSDSLDGSVPNEEKFPFAADFPSQEIEKFLLGSNKKEKELLDFAANHSELSAQVQAEILGAIQDAYEETDIENPNNPFFGENKFVQDFQGLSEGKIFSSLESHRESLYKTQTGKENSADFDFYKNQNEKFLSKKNSAKPETKNKDLEALSPQTLARNLKSDLQKSLQERFLAWQIAEIDKKRKAFLKELYKRIEQFKKLEELLSPFAKSFGRLWDLSRRAFNDCGFEVLKDFADLLEKDESLKELADLIGRQDAEEERYETELREKIELKTEYHPKNAYKGQISGLRLGGEISAVVPSELAMSKNPMAKLYFAQKFAEKKLLSYKYENQVRSVREERSTEEIETPVKEKKQKGPVIICIDTSGSMSGSPERGAKTVTFALAKKCL